VEERWCGDEERRWASGDVNACICTHIRLLTFLNIYLLDVLKLRGGCVLSILKLLREGKNNS
jgi:hypothetical protein